MLRLDALLLRGLAWDLNGVLAGAAVRKISQINDTDLVMALYGQGETRRLLLSLSADDCRVHLVTQERPASQTPGAFCMLLRKHLDGARIVGVDTWGLERLLRIHARRADVSLLLAVELTILSRNVLLAAHGQTLGTWHRPGPHSVLARAVTEPADDAAARPLPPLPDGLVWKSLVAAVFGLNRLAAREVAVGAGLEPDAGYSVSNQAALSASWEAFRTTILTGLFEPTWCPAMKAAAPWVYRVFGGQSTIQYESFSVMLETVQGQGWRERHLTERRKLLMGRLQRLRDRLQRRLQSQQQNLEALADAERWQRRGQLLLSATTASTRSGSVRVTDYEAVPPLVQTVEVDPRYNVSDNAQLCFNRYKKGLRGRVALARQLARGHDEAEWLAELELAACDAQTLADIEEVSEQARGHEAGPNEKAPSRARRQRGRPPIRRFHIEGFEVLVGSNPRQNEEITLRLAAPDDVWLHARRVPGAHVLIRQPGVKAPAAVLLAAARLAAMHSQARTAGRVEVDYTQARYVRKPPDSPPGRVVYRQEKTVLVRLDTPETGVVQD